MTDAEMKLAKIVTFLLMGMIIANFALMKSMGKAKKMTIEELFVSRLLESEKKCNELEVKLRREKKCNEMFESFCTILAKYAELDENGLHITISKYGKEKADCGYVAEFLELTMKGY